MAGLGVSDPRTWDAGSWLSDIVPHLAFGAVVYAALPEPPSRAAAPPKTPPGVVGWDQSERREMARRVNENTADLVAKRPDRFGNFATLPELFEKEVRHGRIHDGCHHHSHRDHDLARPVDILGVLGRCPPPQRRRRIPTHWGPRGNPHSSPRGNQRDACP
jgi:hypothetical protein